MKINLPEPVWQVDNITPETAADLIKFFLQKNMLQFDIIILTNWPIIKQWRNGSIKNVKLCYIEGFTKQSQIEFINFMKFNKKQWRDLRGKKHLESRL